MNPYEAFDLKLSRDNEIDLISVCQWYIFEDCLNLYGVPDLMAQKEFIFNIVEIGEEDDPPAIIKLIKKTTWPTKHEKTGDVFSFNLLLPSGHWMQMGWVNVNWVIAKVEWEA